MACLGNSLHHESIVAVISIMIYMKEKVALSMLRIHLDVIWLGKSSHFGSNWCEREMSAIFVHDFNNVQMYYVAYASVCECFWHTSTGVVLRQVTRVLLSSTCIFFFKFEKTLFLREYILRFRWASKILVALDSYKRCTPWLELETCCADLKLFIIKSQVFYHHGTHLKLMHGWTDVHIFVY